MNLDHYPYLADTEFLEYNFFSEGPNGRIKKIVQFYQIQTEPNIYHLGFGDENPTTGKLDDLVTTNNLDRDKVLATVANTIIDFCYRYGNPYIFAEGSTPARTRLYQISIAVLWEEITIYFDVFGLRDDKWYKFQKNVNYEAFLVKRK